MQPHTVGMETVNSTHHNTSVCTSTILNEQIISQSEALKFVTAADFICAKFFSTLILKRQVKLVLHIIPPNTCSCRQNGPSIQRGTFQRD